MLASSNPLEHLKIRASAGRRPIVCYLLKRSDTENSLANRKVQSDNSSVEVYTVERRYVDIQEA